MVRHRGEIDTAASEQPSITAGGDGWLIGSFRGAAAAYRWFVSSTGSRFVSYTGYRFVRASGSRSIRSTGPCFITFTGSRWFPGSWTERWGGSCLELSLTDLKNRHQSNIKVAVKPRSHWFLLYSLIHKNLLFINSSRCNWTFYQQSEVVSSEKIYCSS